MNPKDRFSYIKARIVQCLVLHLYFSIEEGQAQSGRDHELKHS